MGNICGQLKQSARLAGFKLNDGQLNAFQIYMEMLLEWNEKINLTAITEPSEVVEKHFVDSLMVLQAENIRLGSKVMDVGTGAGFPGIPMKIVRPDLKLTLMDSTNKKLMFLQEVCKKLDLEVTLLHKRAEEAGHDKKLRESFDVVTARAVAPLQILCEYCLPLVKMKGTFMAMKGPGAEEELQHSKNALHILGGDTVRMIPMKTGFGQRNVIIVGKRSFTPKEYPRHGNTITKHPL